MGSVDLRWVRRNAEAHGLPHAPPAGSALRLRIGGSFWLSRLKIDIEGADTVLADLARPAPRPATVSWETVKRAARCCGSMGWLPGVSALP